MPVLRCYVSDDTMKILEHEVIRRGRDETPEMLAENAIAEAAIRSVPLPVRENFDVRPPSDASGSYMGTGSAYWNKDMAGR